MIHELNAPDVQQVLARALEYRKGGRPAEAEALYRQLLARYPRQPFLLAHLAELLMDGGNFGAALPLLAEARAAAPEQAGLWLMQTQCLLRLDRHKDAKKLISEAIGKGLRHPLADELLRQARSGHKPKAERTVPLGEALRQLEGLLQAKRYAEVERHANELLRRYAKAPGAWYFLGMAALLQGRLQDAVAPLERAVALDSSKAPALYNLAFALDGLGRLDEAAALYRRALSVAPQLADAHNNLGLVLHRLGRCEDALAAFDQALALRPRAAAFHVHRGNALRDLGRLENSLSAYEAAIVADGALAEAHVKRALVLFLLGRLEESVAASRRAIELQPESLAAYQGMGKALHKLKRYAEAESAYLSALKLQPDEAETYKNLGVVLRDAGRFDDAIGALERSVALRPDSVNTMNLLASLLLEAGHNDEAIATYRRGLALDRGKGFVLHSNLLFALNYQAGASSDTLLAEARAFGQRAASCATLCTQHENLPDRERRLRVGLVSGDLGQHPVALFLLGVLENLDPARVELYAYETAKRDDEINRRLRRSIPHWRDARDSVLEDAALTSQIREDRIDILVDLAGHTSNNRLPVFACKPAPVQVAWLGYLGTTGLDAMDYVLADAWALPAGEAGQFTETPWRMPETYLCFTPPDVSLEPGGLPALTTGSVTFGCFNNLNKLGGQVVRVWARVLQAVPDSRLFLKTKNLGVSEVREKLEKDFASLGIDPGRLVLEGRFASHEEHFRAYHRVDIALDPFPYPGITTTMEALWMGAPVLSMRGRRFISHQGETILHNLGLPQWIAEDEDDYVAKAVAFAGDLPALADLRARLRERLLASPLCDAPRFARNFEHALRGMWQKWCETQQAPRQAD